MKQLEVQARVLVLADNPHDVRGRSIVGKLQELVAFWGRHRLALAIVMDPAMVEALDAVVAALNAVLLLNPPGPD